MFLLQGFLVGIKPSHFHVFHGAFSITAMWADIEIIVANDHKGVIDGRFHLETIAVLHDEGVFLHDLPLSVANIEVITAKRLIWFSHRDVLRFCVCYKALSRLNSLLPSGFRNDHMTGNTRFSSLIGLHQSMIPSHARRVVALSNICSFPILSGGLRQLSDVSACIKLAICHHLRVRCILGDCQLQIADHL